MNKKELELLIDLVDLEIQDITDFVISRDNGPTIEKIWVDKRNIYRNILKKLQKMLDTNSR